MTLNKIVWNFKPVKPKNITCFKIYEQNIIDLITTYSCCFKGLQSDHMIKIMFLYHQSSKGSNGLLLYKGGRSLLIKSLTIKATIKSLFLVANIQYLLKLVLKPATFLKVTLLHGYFSRFFNLCKWYQIAQHITNVVSLWQNLYPL